MRALFCIALLAAAAPADRVVEREGTVHEGTVVLGADEARLGARRIPLRSLLLAERDDGTLLHAPDFDARLRGYRHLADRALRERCLKLAREALQVGDRLLAAELLDRAEAAGLAGRDTGELKLRLLRTAGGGVPSDRLRREAAKAAGLFADLLAQRARAAGAADPAGLRLLREALRADPASAAALTLLRERAPADFPAGDARVWLDWQIDLLADGARFAPPATPPLARARAQWRRDLEGIAADPFLLVTPVRDSYVIGRCLAHGRLVDRALASLFPSDAGEPTRPPEPMTVLLFESAQEYETTAGLGREPADPSTLRWTAGHYSPADRVSRFFWLKDRDGERRIVGTCAHELTHQWLEERHPRAARAERVGATPLSPGFWIVEGFATFVEEGVFDLDAGRWDPFDPRARSLDIVACLGPETAFLDWSTFYALSQAQFGALGHEAELGCVRQWSFRVEALSRSRLFYEQAAATCHYLFHAHDGDLRARLLRYVDDYYAGNADRLATGAAFGIEPAELGRRVVAFARAVASGWRPKGG